MKSTPTLRFSINRLSILILVSCIAVAALLGIAASANRANRASKGLAKSSTDLSLSESAQQQPAAPLSPTITATLTDNIPAATKVAPGGTINYTAVITNSGVSPTDDATNLNFSDTLDSNTTLTAGSIHASPLAFNDTYNWVGNTFLDTTARALPAVTANDVAVNAPGGTDTFTLTTIAGGPTSLGGTVSLAANGSFTYTPPLGRPNIADGASANDTFPYTITNSADGTLTGTGTVNIVLTGRVWYLQAGAAGDGRSNTPSGSPSAMSTAADKTTDIFYIFSGGGSLNGLFTLDNSQQLLGQGVNLVVNAITLFTATSNPTTTDTTGNGVTLANGNTLRGFDIGNCSGTAISGAASVGTLTINTLSINTTGAGIDLTATGNPAVSVVLGGLTSSGGTKNVNLVNLGGTVTLAGGALSGASGNAFDVNGGVATISYSGTITNTAAARLINIANMTGGSVAFSGALSGTSSSTGINLATNTGATISFTGGMNLSTGSSDAFTATGGGTVNATQNNTSIVNTISSTSGTGLNVTNTTIGASGLTFRSISSGSGANSTANGIILNSTGATAGLTVVGNGSAGTGGTIQHKTGADGSSTQGSGIFLNNTRSISLDRMQLNDFQNYGIVGTTVTNFTLTNSTINGTNGTLQGGIGEGDVYFTGLSGSATVTSCTFSGAAYDTFHVFNDAAQTLNRITITSSSFAMTNTSGNDAVGFQATGGTFNATVQSSTITSARGDLFQLNLLGTVSSDLVFGGASGALGNTLTNNNANIVSGGGGVTIGGGGPTNNITFTYNISNNSMKGSHGAVLAVTKGTGTNASFTGTISNNTIGTQGVAASGSTQGEGIAVFQDGAGTTTVTISNNHVSGVIGSRGAIDVFIHNPTGGLMNATVQGNTIDTLDQANSFAGMYLQTGSNTVSGGSPDTNKSCLTIGGAGGLKNTIDVGANASLAIVAGITLEQEGNAHVGLPGYGGTTTSDVSVQNFVGPNNTVTGSNAQAVFVFHDSTNPPAWFQTCPPPLMFADGGVSSDRVPSDFSTAFDFNHFSSGIDFGRFDLTSVARVTANNELRNSMSASVVTAALTQSQLDSIVSAAIDRWSTTGLTTEQVASMRSIRFEVADLAGAYLGEADGNVIRVDRDAAGNAWFIDTTPFDDLEFGHVIAETRRYTDPLGGPAGHLDLLTGVMHELGHDMGLPDTYALLTRDDLMYGYLVKGERRLPRQDQARGASLSGTTVRHFLSLAPDAPSVTGVKRASRQTGQTSAVPKATAEEVARIYHSEVPWSHQLGPVAQDPNAPTSGEVVSLNTITTFPAGKSITIKYAATVNTPPLARQVSTQGTVSGGNFASVLTDDPDVVGTNQPTVTLIDTTATWSGANSTDWNVDTNWTQGFVPNSVSDVIIPNAGVTNEPNIISMDVNVFTLDLQSARTLTINTGRTLTVNGGLTTLAGALAGGPYTLNFVGLTINHAAGITLNGPTSVSGVLTLTSGNVTTGANVLTIGSAGSIVRTSGHIIGSLKKTTVAAAFVFTVGTVNGYTPVNLTAPSGGGDLTVTTVAAAQPTLQANNPGKSLMEYWILTKAGTLTASLVFNYLQSDVPGTSDEANYRIIRVVGTETASFPQNCPTTSCVDTAANTATISGVSNFSDWTVGEVLAPTASGGVVTGRIVDNNGAPVEGAVVRLSGTQNRKFITDANGFYRFDNVETNGFYTVTPSRANYEFNPAVRSFSQIGETTEATFGATLTSDSNFLNPLDTPEYFVRQHYLDFLGREPDEAGFNFWSDQILECGTDTNCVERRRENVSAAYFLSIEFQATGGLVDGLYRASYGVRPQFAQFIPDTRAVGLGVIVGQEGWQAKLQANKQAFVDAFVNRPAFHTAYDGMDSGLFVDTLISHTGVTFTSGEHDVLVSGLANGTLTRAAVLQSIAENQGFINAKFNDAFVMMEYFGYLRRDADASGFAFWLNKLNEFGGNFEQAEMVKAFIVSSEYRGRFPR